MFVKCVVQHGSNQDKLNVVQIDPPGNGTPYEIDIKMHGIVTHK